MLKANIETFLACDASYEEAGIVLYGAPFDSTTSYRPGTRFGSRAIRSESYGLESYSSYQDRDLTDYAVFDAGDQELCFGDASLALKDLRERAAEVAGDGKIPFMLGGEHLVTLAPVQALAEKYPELKEYRKGGNRQSNKLPVWVAFSYFDFGTVTMMYNYLRGDLRKSVLVYSFQKGNYAKRDTELVDTWLDAVRNLRNYCAHNSMVVGMNSSVALLDPVDDAKILPEDNDLYSRLYALKKLIPAEDKEKLKKDIQRLIKRTSLDINLLGILPENWEEMYDQITEF